MGKRLLEDSDLGTDGPAGKHEGRALKKSRKEVGAEKTHKKSHASATSTAEVSAPTAAQTEAVPSTLAEEKLSKEERKALKQAKKEAKAAKKAADNAVVEDTADAGADNGVDSAVASGDKAARKAETARLKALKKAEKAALLEAGVSASGTDTPVTIDSASAASKVQSSVTSPEPDESGKTATSDYTEHSGLTALPQSEIDEYLSKNLITIADPLKGNNSTRPLTSFSYLPKMDESMLAPFKTFTAPTPIQAAAWPSLFAGRDVIGVAETGSGKTLAFGVPCVQHIRSLPQKERKGAKACIVSPTRELAMQIYEQLVSLATPAGLKVVCVYGGVPKDDQIRALKTANIVVATPGRLNDLINDGAANLSKVDYMVLDEADRMLDKGFEEEIRKIISNTLDKSQRQTLMFTATWPQSVRDLAATFMKDPVKIMIGDNPTGELRANTRIEQVVEVVDPRAKEQRLIQLLKQHQSGKNKDDRILVFCLYKKEATRVENFIRTKGFRVAGIHGDLSQTQRTASLDAFKQGKVPLLVATDVAARGLDIPAVKMVINVTFPLTAEDYVHRIGRTGRAGMTGKAVTLFTDHDKPLAGALINVLKAANQPVPEDLLKFGTTVKKKGHDAYGAFYKDTGDMKKATKITFD